MRARVAIVGGGIAGLAAAYECTKLNIPFVLFEASDRLGGIVETVRQDGFVMECGPDAWVSEKPWARDLAEELGLADEIIHSNDETRVTWVVRDGVLYAMPDGMRMMVPTDLHALSSSALFTLSAIAAYREEPQRAAKLKAYALEHESEDESVSAFVERHFGEEVTRTLAAPLLAGVFGGDVERLSANTVMAPFKQMEREHGSLILALQNRKSTKTEPIFTTLRNGVGTLAERIIAALPEGSIRLSTPAQRIERDGAAWRINKKAFAHLLLATPAHVTRELLAGIDAETAQLLEMEASSAIIVGFGFAGSEKIELPAGFGFLVPPGTPDCDLLAGTFLHQKFPHRTPDGAYALRAFFGGDAGLRLQSESDEYLAGLARAQLSQLLQCALPEPSFTIVRRWPHSLPQYNVGHTERMRRLHEQLLMLPGLSLLGNAYNGVGLPDLIRDARAAVGQIKTD